MKLGKKYNNSSILKLFQTFTFLKLIFTYTKLEHSLSKDVPNLFLSWKIVMSHSFGWHTHEESYYFCISVGKMTITVTTKEKTDRIKIYTKQKRIWFDAGRMTLLYKSWRKTKTKQIVSPSMRVWAEAEIIIRDMRRLWKTYFKLFTFSSVRHSGPSFQCAFSTSTISTFVGLSFRLFRAHQENVVRPFV